MNQNRQLWIDTQGEPVITTTANGEANARRWGWTPAKAVPLEQPEEVPYRPVERFGAEGGRLLPSSRTEAP